MRLRALHGVHRLVVALATLELEGHGDDAHGEDARRLGDAGDDGSRAGTGAAAHARGDEHHVGAGESLLDGLPALLGRFLADLGVAARAEAAGPGSLPTWMWQSSGTAAVAIGA